jgi:anhydro-N-acetylmuramic acid kinase
LLAQLYSEPYFAAPPPKSTGRDLFNARWLDAALADVTLDPALPATGAMHPARAATGSTHATARRVTARDVQATLVALTARSIAEAIRRYAAGATEVLVAGGGAHNGALLLALARELGSTSVRTTETEGVAVDHVEALAFAWLAKAALEGAPGNLAAVTGARGPRILGAVYRH